MQVQLVIVLAYFVVSMFISQCYMAFVLYLLNIVHSKHLSLNGQKHPAFAF